MNDDENEDIESGLDVLKDTVGDIVDEDTESPLGQVMVDAAERPTVESRPFRGMLVKELEEASKRLMAKPAAPSSPLDRLIERFNVPTGKSGDLFVARQQREQERAKADAERRKELMNVLAKLEQTESQGILEKQREEAARQKALQGEKDPESFRALVRRAEASNRTVPEQIEWEANLKRPPPPKSPGIEALDRKIGNDYAEWISREGAKSATNVKKLKNAMNRLKTDKNITGPVSGYVVENFPTLASVIYPEAKDIKSIVESVVQQDLRQILGGQFAAAENTELIKRAYDPTIGDERNFARLELLLNQIEEVTGSKTSAFDYLNKNGTMAGFEYKQKRVTPDDFLTESDIKKLEGKKPDRKGTPETKVIDGETWNLFIDNNGNKAYVSPDGLRFEEVK